MTKTTVSGCDDASVLNVKSLTALIESHSNQSDTHECVSASKAEQFKPLIRTIQNHIVYEQDGIHVEPTLHYYCPVYFSDVEKLFRHCSFTVCAYCEHSHRHSQVRNIKPVRTHAMKENAPPKAIRTGSLSTLRRIELNKNQDFQVLGNMTAIDSSVPISEETVHDTTVGRSGIVREEMDEHFDNSPTDSFKERTLTATVSLDHNEKVPAIIVYEETVTTRRPITDERSTTEKVLLNLNVAPGGSISKESDYSNAKHSHEVIEISDQSTVAGRDIPVVPAETDVQFVKISTRAVEPSSLDLNEKVPAVSLYEEIITTSRPITEERNTIEKVSLNRNVAPGGSISKEIEYSNDKPSQDVIEILDQSTVAGRDIPVVPAETDVRFGKTSPRAVEPSSLDLNEKAPAVSLYEETITTCTSQPITEERSTIEKVSLNLNVAPSGSISKESDYSNDKPSQEVIEILDESTVAGRDIPAVPIETDVFVKTSAQAVEPSSSLLLPKMTEKATKERTVTERVSLERNKISPAVTLSEKKARSDTKLSHKIIEISDNSMEADEDNGQIVNSSPQIPKPNGSHSFPTVAETTILRRSVTDSFAELSQDDTELSDNSILSNSQSEDSESDPEFLVSPLKPVRSSVVITKVSPTSAGATKCISRPTSMQRYMDQILEDHDKQEYLKKIVSDRAVEFSTSLAGELILSPLPLKTIEDWDPPGLQVFDMSRMCHFFDSSCISISEKVLPTETSSSFEKKLVSIPTDILLHVIESKGLESCAVGHLSEVTKNSLLNFLWRIMAVSEKYPLVLSCQSLINYIVCELNNKWMPSLVDVAAILVNLGATENGCPLKDLLHMATVHLYEEFPRVVFSEPTNPEQIFQNLRRLLQTLASLIVQSNYSSLESAHFVLLMCWLFLDPKLNNYGLKPEIQSCIREGLDKITEGDWPEKLEYLCRELVLLGKDHPNLSWMATFFPPSTRGLQLQRSFSFTVIQILVDKEPVFCSQVSPQDVLRFLRHRKIDRKLDRHLLYNFFQLLNMSISLRILQQDENAVKELADTIMETFSMLRDNSCEVETTKVKTLLVGIRTKWMCLVNSTAIKKAYCPDSPSSLSSDSR